MAHLSGAISDGPFTPANILQVIVAKAGPGGIPGFCVELSTYSLIAALLSGLKGLPGSVPLSSGPRPKMFVWVPASILQAALLEMVNQYEATRTQVHIFSASLTYSC